MTEVGVARAGGEDQRVIAHHRAVFGPHLPGLGVDPGHPRQQGFDVAAAPHQGPDRPGDLGGRQGGGGDLVEQGLEQMMVALIDKGDARPGALQRLHRLQSAEARPHDDHAGTALHALMRRIGVRDRHAGSTRPRPQPAA